MKDLISRSPDLHADADKSRRQAKDKKKKRRKIEETNARGHVNTKATNNTQNHCNTGMNTVQKRTRMRQRGKENNNSTSRE
ncbi:hypothetical protein, partial [Enterobacter cloacae]|uniref:hypothetical protein n=1 Tax=Enterobacter cloacae TaxID=550 RepID=UPI001BCABEAB